MTHQISVPFEEKLDEPLAEICNGLELAPSSRVPVLIRAVGAALPDLAKKVVALGGTVRHEIVLLGILAAWVPISSVSVLARDASVTAIELEQTFSAQRADR